MNWAYILGILGIAIVLYLISSLRVLRQYGRGVVFLLGKFEGVRGAGLALIFTPIQQMARVSLRIKSVALALSNRQNQTTHCEAGSAGTGRSN
jgi:regulator of protease activity HflC (stomatin/prohibitin superfamily)